MHLEVYVEEPSAKQLLDVLLPRILCQAHSFDVHPFRGKSELLREIPKRLRGYASWLPRHWRVAVLIDEDRQDCHALKQQILDAASVAGVGERLLARIVIEELEAWYFGDIEALRRAYPRVPRNLGHRQGFREPDAIAGGTWERLDQLLKRAGYREGLQKITAARAIAPHMDPERNRSKSFQVFRDGIRRLAGAPP